jgi:hypothetical protein
VFSSVSGALDSNIEFIVMLKLQFNLFLVLKVVSGNFYKGQIAALLEECALYRPVDSDGSCITSSHVLTHVS